MITKKRLLIPIAMIACFLMLALAGCVTNKVILDRIEVETAPKSVYNLGESLNISEGVLKAVYSDGGVGYVPFTDERVSFSELDKDKAGTQSITVRFDTRDTSFPVTVMDVATSVEWVEKPAKTSYIQGERFDVRGAKVKILYEGGVEHTVELTQTMLNAEGSRYTLEGFDSEKLGKSTVEIVFLNHETRFTLPFDVTVRKKRVTGFTLTQKDPNKTNYEKGAELELDQLRFRVAYDNNIPLDATIEKSDDGKYLLRDAAGNVLEGEVKLYTLVGNVRIEGFENTSTGSKELVFRYITAVDTAHDAYGLRINVVEKAIASFNFSVRQQLVKGTPADQIAEALSGGFIEVIYTDDSKKTFRFPEDATGEDKKVEIHGYDPISMEDTQRIYFDFGADGTVYKEFDMIERAITGLSAVDTGDYDLSDKRLNFYTGDGLDVSEWRFALEYSNGTEDFYLGRDLTISSNLPAGEADYFNARFDFLTAGEYKISFGYVGMANFDLNVTVYDKTLSDLTIEKSPDLTEYSVGDEISLRGLMLRADYIDPESGAVVRSRYVSEYEITVEYDNHSAGTFDVTLSLTENGVTKSAVFPVRFHALVSGIEIESAIHTDYVKGAAFNPGGLVVVIRYEGAADERVELKEHNEGAAWTFAPAILTTVGIVPVTVGYMGKNAVLNVTVHNDVDRFILKDADGGEYEEGTTVGEITVGIAVAEKLRRWTFVAVRENGETETFALPNGNVSVTADNSQSWEQEKRLEVRFRYLGEEGLFYLNRLERKHSYYELIGKPQGLQTATSGFNPEGLGLREYFDNGTLKLLEEGADYRYDVPGITFPENSDRVEVAVGICLADGTRISFRWGAAGEVSVFPVTFYEKIAKKISWKEQPADSFKIDEGTPAEQVLPLLANAETVTGNPVTLIATYSDDTTAEIVLKDHLADFTLKNYDHSLPDNDSVSLFYSLGADVSVDLVLRINPKLLVSVQEEGYLIGALGTNVEGTVVEGTDLNYSKAFLSVVYGYADGDTLKETTNLVPIQSSWSDFDKTKTYAAPDNRVTISYSYRGVTKSVFYEITTVGKEVDEVSLLVSPKNAFIEGENFTFETADGVGYGVLRVGYNNGTSKTLSLDPDNRYQSGMSDAEAYYQVVSNEMTEYFASVGGYEKVELSGGNTKTFIVTLLYMGRNVQYQVVLKDRASVTFDYEMEGSSEKLYGDPVGVTLVVLSDGIAVEEGERRVSYRNEDGAVYQPRDGKFDRDGVEYAYLPAGSYTIEAHFDGVPIRFNPGEKDIGTFNVSKRTLVLSYAPIDSMVYGDPNPDFIGSYLGYAGFATGESVNDLNGSIALVTYLNGVRLVSAPADANRGGTFYEMGAEGLESDNYDIVYPGERANPFGAFTIEPLSIYVDPVEQTVVYGTAVPSVGYTAYFANADGSNKGDLLDERFVTELSGAPDAYREGVNLDDDAIRATQPNAGRYELNVAVMSGENPNFEIYAPAGKYVRIDRAPLTVSYTAKSVVYGDPIAFGDVASNLVVEGWKRNDEGNVVFEVGFKINGAGEYLTGEALIAAMKDAGRYTLTAGSMNFDNYVVDAVRDGVFTVAPKSVVVTPETARKTYGTADPSFRYRAEGLLAGDALSGALTREPGEDATGAGYRILIGTLANPNYALSLSAEPVYFNIAKRELILNVKSEDLKKFYDGYAPSIGEYALTLADGGAPADSAAYIDGTAPDKSKIRLAFALQNGNVTVSPDRTSATSPLTVILMNEDSNHTVVLATDYKYAIERLPVEIEWLKATLDGTELKPFASGSSYPYIYGGKHYLTARVKIPDGTAINPDVITEENLAVSLSPAFDQYYDKATGWYGIANADTYAPAVTANGVKNTNFTLSNYASTSTRIVVEPNTVYVSLDESARSKDYDRTNATVNTLNLNSVTLYERETDELGAIVAGSNVYKTITDEDYKKAVVRILDFKVGNKANGVSDVATDTPDGSYPITMSVSDPVLGSNFRAEFNDDDSQKYFIRPRAIAITVYGINQKVYDGVAPFISAGDLASSDATYVTSSQLQDMLQFTAVDPEARMGDVGDYTLGVDAAKNANYNLSFVDSYVYKIIKKEISVTLTEGSGYYIGEKQLALTESDVKARDNNLGSGDSWSDVFPAIKDSFTFRYLSNTGYPELSVGNDSGQRGNVGDYELTLNTASAEHKNYTFVWSGQTTFTVKPAEVTIQPNRTTSVYGEAEGDNAVYLRAYSPVFEKGSDGADGSVFLSYEAVKNNLTLMRSNPDRMDVGYYNVALSDAWVDGSVDGVNRDLPNYRVSLSGYDGANRFQITKRPLTVKIRDYQKTFGTSVSNADLEVEFPNLADELKNDGALFADTLLSILASYGLTERGTNVYSFAENVSYRYAFKGSAGDASALPTDALANATRNGDRYEITFASLPNMENYEFVYAETAAEFEILPKSLEITADDFEWTYRDPWQSAAAGADETNLNFGSFFNVTGKVPGDTAELKYPVLAMDGGFAEAHRLLTEGNAGSSVKIDAAWFDVTETNDPSRNRNYIYDFGSLTGAHTATVAKAELKAIVETSAGGHEIQKVYGDLPAEAELRIVYSGFRGDDEAAYRNNPASVIGSGAKIPNFVQVLTAGEGGDLTAVLYGAGEHKIAPDARDFDATNYTVDVDPQTTENALTFRVTKKLLTVKSAPVAGGESVLRKFYGTPLERGTDYEVSFDGFVNSVRLPDGSSVLVADSAETEFYNRNPMAEWVSYTTAVNVVRNNVEIPAEIAPNVDLMNAISNNYDVAPVTGESLNLAIYNKIKSVETANKTGGAYYSYVVNKARSADANFIRVKVSYIDGSDDYIDLPLLATEQEILTDNHTLWFTVADYVAAVGANQSIRISVREENALAEHGADQAELPLTVRDVTSADYTLNQNDLDANFIGTPLDARTDAVEREIRYASGAPGIAARFNLLDVSFLLMRTNMGGSFDLIFYNARNKEDASYRYVLRFEVNRSLNEVRFFEQPKKEDGTFDTAVGAGETRGLSEIDVFDETLHTARVFLNKLTNVLNLEIDGVVFMSIGVTNGTLQGETGETLAGFGLENAYGYVMNATLSTEGYSAEDAVRISAKEDAERVIPLGLEPYARISPADYFAFIWNYAGDYYDGDYGAPNVRYYIDGAETGLTYGRISLAAGSYRLTARAFRGTMLLSEKTVEITVSDGYYIDKYRYDSGDAFVTVTPRVNNPASLMGGAGGRTYEGVVSNADFSHYRLDADAFDLAESSDAYSRAIDLNLKTSDPAYSAFTAPDRSNNYTGLTLRIQRRGTDYTTGLKLVAGDGARSVRPAEQQTTAIDWTRKNGVYSIDAAFDQKNLYVRVEILWNNESLYIFYLDGAIAGTNPGDQDAETATGRADVENPDAMYQKAPNSWAVATLANLRAGHSVILESGTGVIARRVTLNTLSDRRDGYIKTESTTSGITTLNPSYVPLNQNGVDASMAQTGREASFMLGQNNFATPGSKSVRAGVYRYETYGVRFTASPVAGMTNKLRFILAENAPKTASDAANRYSAKAMRNVSLTFIRKTGENTRLFFSFNDAVYNTGMSLDEVGEVKNVRYEQEVYSFPAGSPGEGQIDLFDGKEHEILVTFDRKENNVELSTGLVAQVTLANFVEIYIDGQKRGGQFLFPEYNNVSPWYYTDESGNKNAVPQSTAPFYDRYFLDEKTSAGLAFRGIDIKISALAVSEKPDHLNFLS